MAVGASLGVASLFTALILAILEISLSFDNAVVNAKILKNMDPVWQKLFLTVGMIFAVLGVRVFLPILLVAVFSGMSLGSVVHLVLSDSRRYGEILHTIHPEIAAFGGIFLLMLFLDFVLNGKHLLWLHHIEEPLRKLGQLERLEVVIALLALAVATTLAPSHHAASMLYSGAAALALYLIVKGEGENFEARQTATKLAQAGLISFIYLNILDASFSLDGVLGAFAISSNIIVIVVGLTIGALWVRSMTIHLVASDTLSRFQYLENGAYYAIGVLAILLLASASREISEAVTGLAGAVIIAASLADSVKLNRARQ